VIALQLSEAPRTGPGNDGHVMAGARKLISVGAADAPGADDGDRKRGCGGAARSSILPSSCRSAIS
jgi:hypothetical protein